MFRSTAALVALAAAALLTSSDARAHCFVGARFTAQVGYEIPSSSSSVSVDLDTGDVSVDLHPRFLDYGFSLQYSMPYLKSSVIDLQLPDFFNHLIPLVEAKFQTSVSNNFDTGIGTTGTIQPGVIWVGSYFQVGVEAPYRSIVTADPASAWWRSFTSISTTSSRQPSVSRCSAD